MRLIQKIQNSTFERHVHLEPYAAVVLSGGYEEAGDSGRFEVKTGNVVFHDWFEAHRNRFSTAGATVLNLPLPAGSWLVQGLASVPDPGLVVRVAERNRRAAADLLVSEAVTKVPDAWDWPDELAARLNTSPCLKLSEWGEQNGLAGWTISRGFQQVFGVSPETFRARVRTRRALRSIRATKTPLASIAAELGFSDQAHMTRSVKQLTGRTPQAWRALQMDSIHEAAHSL
jgi:AraC-like DNA-binding protein